MAKIEFGTSNLHHCGRVGGSKPSTDLHTTMLVGLTVAVGGSADRASRSLRAGPNFDGKLNTQPGSSKLLHCTDRLATWLMKPCWEIPANLRR